jgi:tetratricopeptide (TPR) repeat protein
LCAIVLAPIASIPAQTEIALIEEEESFWNEFLAQEGIANKNLLHASFVAYRERMFDLSIESLRECIARNDKNASVISIATYFLGKNNFQLGNFGEAIRLFAEARDMELGRFAYLRHAITLNMAIAYHRLGNTAHFRRLVQTVIEADAAGKYGQKAKELLDVVK